MQSVEPTWFPSPHCDGRPMLVKLPLAHGVQFTVGSLLYKPAEQAVHLAAPPSASVFVTDPAAHVRQSPISLLYIPGSHWLHNVAPPSVSSALTAEPEQSWHGTVDTGLKRPAEHCVHEVPFSASPTSVIDPASQNEHSVAVSRELKSPGSHAAQESNPACAYVPASQPKHEAVAASDSAMNEELSQVEQLLPPCSLYIPIGQWRHCEAPVVTPWPHGTHASEHLTNPRIGQPSR